MNEGTYLLGLAARLAVGLSGLASTNRSRHAAFIRSRQQPDGGFPGREGGSDLYYTGFALRSLAVLGELTAEIAEHAAGYLRPSLNRQASVVDFFSLLYAAALVQLGGGGDVFADSPADWPERVADLLETFRTADGGYGKTPGGAAGSTYHTFLVGLTYELLGREVPRPDEVVRFLLGRRREDGGFVEIAPMRRSGTNPTAAAVGMLQVLERQTGAPLADDVRDGAIRFLLAMPSAEGGLRANGRAPLADLLSTFTGAWTLEQLGARDRLDAAAVLDFTRAVELPAGGFRGGLWDDATDVEYTFYGLGVFALLTP